SKSRRPSAVPPRPATAATQPVWKPSAKSSGPNAPLTQNEHFTQHTDSPRPAGRRAVEAGAGPARLRVELADVCRRSRVEGPGACVVAGVRRTRRGGRFRLRFRLLRAPSDRGARARFFG